MPATMQLSDLESALDALRQEAVRAGISLSEIAGVFRDAGVWATVEAEVYPLRGTVAK